MRKARWSRCVLLSGVSGLILGVAMAGRACSVQEPATSQFPNVYSYYSAEEPNKVLADMNILFTSSRYWLGVEVSPARGALAAQLDLPNGKGLVVDNVVPQSPAAKAGVKQYDVFVSLGGTPLAEVGDLGKALDKVGAKEMTLDLLRSGKKETLRVTPVDRAVSYGTGAGHSGSEAEMKTGTEYPVFTYTLAQPFVATPSKPLEFPKDLKVIITKQGPSPAEVIVTRGDKTWRVTDKTLEQLPEEVRKPVQEFLSRSAGEVGFELRAETISFGSDGKTITATGAPLQFLQRFASHPEKPGTTVSPPPAPRDSIEKRLDEISRRLEAIEKTLKQDNR